MWKGNVIEFAHGVGNIVVGLERGVDGGGEIRRVHAAPTVDEIVGRVDAMDGRVRVGLRRFRVRQIRHDHAHEVGRHAWRGGKRVQYPGGYFWSKYAKQFLARITYNQI